MCTAWIDTPDVGYSTCVATEPHERHVDDTGQVEWTGGPPAGTSWKQIWVQGKLIYGEAQP